jgi:hypothetical protein
LKIYEDDFLEIHFGGRVFHRKKWNVWSLYMEVGPSGRLYLSSTKRHNNLMTDEVRQIGPKKFLEETHEGMARIVRIK